MTFYVTISIMLQLFLMKFKKKIWWANLRTYEYENALQIADNDVKTDLYIQPLCKLSTCIWCLKVLWNFQSRG